MKKLFISIVAVLFAATFSFAQNTMLLLLKAGNYNTHMVDQTGSNTSTLLKLLVKFGE